MSELGEYERMLDRAIRDAEIDAQRDEQIATLTAELEQARERNGELEISIAALRVERKARDAELEQARRQIEMEREERANDEVAWRRDQRENQQAYEQCRAREAGVRHELEQARRDIGRLQEALGLVVQELDDVERDGTDIAFGYNERDIIRAAFNGTATP